MPKGIYERTIEIRNKNSMSNKGKISGFKGKHHSDEAKKKNSISHKGKKLPPFTEEHKRKIGISKLGNKNNFGKKASEETRRKLSEYQKNRPPISEETLEKMRKNNRGEGNPMYGRKGVLSPLYGRKLSEEHKKKIGKAVSGDKCHFWQGGKSFELYTTDWTRTLKRSIRERDQYICRLCGIEQNDRLHDVHHIDYDKKNCNPKNLITLCLKCHRKTNHKRDYWINYFDN